MERIEDAPGGLDTEDEHGVCIHDVLHDVGETLAAGQAVHMLDGFDLAVEGTVEGVFLIVLLAKRTQAVGDQPGGLRVAAQALLDVIEVAITQGSQETPH